MGGSSSLQPPFSFKGLAPSACPYNVGAHVGKKHGQANEDGAGLSY